MALPLGKLTILVGAGIVGSVLAKEGGMSSVSDFFSGAFKIAYRQLKHDDSTPSVNKPRNEYLVAQELQILASNRPITIVTGHGTGTSKYSIIIVVVVVGYGYVWWKGWRLPSMMFATRRSLSDARDAIAKQLEGVSRQSRQVTRRQLSSRIESLDNRLDEIADITSTTQEEVSLVQDKSKKLNTNVQSVRYVVQNLESKIKRIEAKQDMTNEGVNWLCDYAQTIEQNRSFDRIQASPASSSRPALEAPMRTPSRSESLPPIIPVESPSPSHALKPSDSNGIPKEVSESSSRDVGNGNRTPEDNANGSSSSGFFGTMFSSRNASFSFLARTRGAANAAPKQTGGSNGKQE